jgi:hypothetical protein
MKPKEEKKKTCQNCYWLGKVKFLRARIFVDCKRRHDTFLCCKTRFSSNPKKSQFFVGKGICEEYKQRQYN